jgi:hypothetical protein
MLGSTTERALANDASKKSVLFRGSSSSSSSSTPIRVIWWLPLLVGGLKDFLPPCPSLTLLDGGDNT